MLCGRNVEFVDYSVRVVSSNMTIMTSRLIHTPLHAIAVGMRNATVIGLVILRRVMRVVAAVQKT